MEAPLDAFFYKYVVKILEDFGLPKPASDVSSMIINDVPLINLYSVNNGDETVKKKFAQIIDLWGRKLYNRRNQFNCAPSADGAMTRIDRHDRPFGGWEIARAWEGRYA